MSALSPSSLGAVLENNALTRGEAPGLLSPGGDSWSHSALLQSTHSISRSLIALGAEPGTTVAVSLPEGVHLARALLGTLCGHVALPLGVDLPLPEARSLVGPLRPAAFVVAAGQPSALRALADQSGRPLLELDPGSPTGQAADLDLPARSAGDPAVVLYTSGTTGQPKPATLSHGNILHALRSVASSLRLGPEDRCLNLMPLVHAHGLLGALLSSLAGGGSAVCTESLDPRLLLRWASRRACTWTTASPTVLRLLLDAPGTWPGLRLLRSASAPMPRELALALEERFGVPQIQVYGLTEAYQVAANPLPPGERRHGSVGWPTGCEVAILDEEGARRPAGEEGEVALKGPNVFRGYGPPGGEPQRGAFCGGWFRTGDLGTFDTEGYLHLGGRMDERINRGGEKVSPQRVEAALAEHPDVDEALCFPVPDEALGEEIGALVRGRPGATLDPQTLRRFAATHLAPSQVPRFYWFLDELPGPASSKVRRRELAGSLQRRTGARDMHDTAPGASLRDALRDIWQEQLGLESPPRDDDRFFDLGGTSLGLVELVITIERRLGAILPLSTILEAPTLAELADLIGAGRRPERTREICVERERFTVRLLPIQPRGERAPLLFVAPAGGSVLPYYALADALPRDRPFWGLQIDLPRRSLRRPFGIPELADAFAEGIETLSPTSPVTLGGWSFGALVAWEIAARMSAGGRPVERVIALDCHALRYGPSAGRERLGDLIVNIARMIRESRPLVRDALYLRLVAQDKERSAGSAEGKRTRRSVLRALVARAARNAEVAELLDKDPRLAELQTDGLSIIGSLRHYLVAARRYDPPHLAVPVDVLKAEGSSQADARLGWEHISDGRVDAHLVPGDHYNLLTRPHVKGVAAVMALVLGEET